ncbi:phosphoribosylformylglycinamidine synthase [Candidatus Peregrinibacteria bacterium]|nr:phosphoribosylformylglycinamidine synthase [Candidatus Peregrinibacteria bacterium]
MQKEKFSHRIEISTTVNDQKSEVLLKKLTALGFSLSKIKVVEVYTINKSFTSDTSGELQNIAEILSNPIFQGFKIDQPTDANHFDYILEIGFLPGVTDNIASTAKETIEDFTKEKFAPQESVHTSTMIFLKAAKEKPLTKEGSKETVEQIGLTLSNPLIQRLHIKSFKKYTNDKGMDKIVPKVQLTESPQTDEVNLNVAEEELEKISSKGIKNKDGTRRGPLALEKDYIAAIKKYFAKEERNPTDIELESLAQTWSEHCKHTIFAAEMDEIKEGLYKGCIKKATEEIRKQKGEKDFCVSVFSDNSGGIIFDENYLITDKAETHNSPSSLDPFGGAITGIVGVNRDTIGFGKGAKPIINKYGFCVGLPNDKKPLYRDKEKTAPTLSPRRILDGVVEGVNAGGNQSGIATPQGFVYFDESYKGKPLVFVGTVGLIPRKIGNKPSHIKKAQPGEKIVVIGGKVGQDGIHGATFSSEALTAGSPATAVQIGDPITQKKLSDAIIKEARALDLYDSITDCGAGGISCSVSEMAKESGGYIVDLNKVPLKYPNLQPWQIWISESQERMTLAVPKKNLEKFTKLMEARGVETSVIGEFTDSPCCSVKYNNKEVMNLDMDFLHNGLPKKTLHTQYKKPQNEEPDFTQPQDLTHELLQMLARPNIASFEWISRQYDHTVQGGAVIGPVIGEGRLNTKASVTKPFLETEKGIVIAQSIAPRYSLIDTYHMAACTIDMAICQNIAVGGNLDHMALMDNFCWCSSKDPQRLGELKAAAKACFDYAVAYSTPYISGKDSMFNDFSGFDEKGEKIKISALPTLMISSLSVIKDVTKTITPDLKLPGDLIYILGETKNELGGSEYFASKKDSAQNCIGNEVPKVDSEKALDLYRKFMQAVDQRLLASAISIDIGGLGIALAQKSIASQLGLEVDLEEIPKSEDLKREDYMLFSETRSRFIVTIAPENKEKFEKNFKGIPLKKIGHVTKEKKFSIRNLVTTDVKTLTEAYKSTFKDY